MFSENSWTSTASAGDLRVEEVNIPILTYHSIDESGSVISTAPDIFRRQMNYLSQTNWNVVSLTDLVCSLVDKTPISPKTVVLTFDDGFQNFYTAAFPVLEEHGFIATVFLVTEYCGKRNEWEADSADIPLNKMLSWEEIKRLNECGIEFGAHTLSHPNLTKIPVKQAEREIVESKSVIEERLGTETATFAYPYGLFNEQVKQIAKDYFKAAVSTNLGMVRAGNDIHALKRLDTFYLKDERLFRSLSTRKFEFYMRFRHVLRQMKAKLYHQ